HHWKVWVQLLHHLQLGLYHCDPNHQTITGKSVQLLHLLHFLGSMAAPLCDPNHQTITGKSGATAAPFAAMAVPLRHSTNHQTITGKSGATAAPFAARAVPLRPPTIQTITGKSGATAAPFAARAVLLRPQPSNHHWKVWCNCCTICS
ncbi:hypothetical protein RRG08_001279, partial [Elysia crispata]